MLRDNASEDDEGPGLDGADDAADDGAEFDPEDFEPRAFRFPERRRVLLALAVVVASVAVLVVPPLISVNRFRRQIARSIQASVGRPVHIKDVTLDVLPWPGFRLTEFVMSEDPAFGTEPVIRADTVTAQIRLRSLWRRRVEFSRITLEDPSVNLVRRADGRWNVESILLQAAKIEAAPTAAAASAAPRFPYISATGARVNLKEGLEKLPISLTEADFSLWLPEPEQWQLRLEGHPTRTDAAAMDTGTFQMQGSLGRAAVLKDMPVDLTAEWRSAPMGAMSWIVLGRDAGLRGEMTLRTSVTGTMGENRLDSLLELRQVRRAEFVPAEALDAEIGCTARTARMFHEFDDVRCVWPVESDKPGMVAAGQVPEVQDLSSATGTVTLRKIPAETLLNGLRLGTPRVSPELHATGNLGGSLAVASTGVSGSLMLTELVVTVGDGAPIVDGEISAEVTPGVVTVRPIGLKLGAPAPASLDAKIDRAGYTMHLSGGVLRSRLMQLASALPQFGDGLAEILPAAPDADAKVETPMRVDLVSAHPWGGGQSWTVAVAARPAAKRRRTRR